MTLLQVGDRKEIVFTLSHPREPHIFPCSLHSNSSLFFPSQTDLDRIRFKGFHSRIHF